MPSPKAPRSQGGYPNRFRRGAFEIACELRADVLPIVLCNTRSCVPRDAFWVGDFWMSVKALPRVTPVEFDYELGARALMQHVQQLVRAEVEAENRRIHSHRSYLLAHVAGLYRFQGRSLRRRVRHRLRTSREAPPWIDALSNFGSVLVLESELGVLGHLASLPNLRLNCIVELQAPRDLRAAHVSAASNERLTFVAWGSADASRVEFDAVVIARGVDGSELVPRLTSLAPETLVLLEVANEALETELRESGFQPRANLAQAYERVASPGRVS